MEVHCVVIEGWSDSCYPIGTLRELLILAKKRRCKVQRQPVWDDLKQQTSEALTTETKKQFSKTRRGKVQSVTDSS